MMGGHAREKVKVEESIFGRTSAGEDILQITLSNASGIRVRVLNYGAMLVGVETPDREGRLENITLYLDSWEDYEAGHPLFGSVVGRFANRIDGGGFEIGGKRYDLETVNAKTGVHIHGGKTGFQRQVWNVEPVSEIESGLPGEGKAGIALKLLSPDGHEGYPGEVRAEVRYLLDGDASELTIQYLAGTTESTHVNLTNHAYWNLRGAGSGDILGHELLIHADQMLAIDQRRIPTGEFLDVDDTAFDFRESRLIGAGIGETGGGYDHCYVLSRADERPLRPCARVFDAVSGRVMEVSTTQPGVQVYTANGLSEKLSGGGKPYGKYHGICLETQHFPDSPNKPEFPTTLLRPEQAYFEETVFSFSVEGSE
jgi:aldose 1-epimerase